MTHLLTERPLTQNGQGGQVYLPPEFVEQFAQPLELAESCTAVVVPHKAVVLIPGSDPEFPVELTVRHPESYQLTTKTPDSDTTHGI